MYEFISGYNLQTNAECIIRNIMINIISFTSNVSFYLYKNHCMHIETYSGSNINDDRV